MIRQCVILAGGNGSRLKPLWDGPKTLVPVKVRPMFLRRPFAKLQLEWLARQGVWEVVYCAGSHVEAIRKELGETQYGMRLKYVADDNAGTAGALRAAFEASVLAYKFLVLYGDSYLRDDLSGFGVGDKGVAMTVLQNENLLAPSNVAVEGDRILAFGADVPGAQHIDYGIWVMRGSAVAAFPDEGDLPAAVERHIRSNDVVMFEATDRFYEVGTPQGVAELESFLDLERSAP